MKFNKVIVTADLAHFKNSRGAKNQSTHDIPPISTVVGILKNVYGEEIRDFKFGYTFSSRGKCKQMEHIHKEVNIGVNTLNNKERYAMYPSIIEYHTSPVLTIYHTIEDDIQLETPLNLGRQCCMAKAKFEEVEIYYTQSTQNNVLTEVADGRGVIHRGNTETVYDEFKGYFDIYTKPLRINIDDEVKVCYEDENGNGIYLWNYIEKGNVECYKEKL